MNRSPLLCGVFLGSLLLSGCGSKEQSPAVNNSAPAATSGAAVSKEPATTKLTPAPTGEKGRFGSGGAPAAEVANLVGNWSGIAEVPAGKMQEAMARLGDVELELKKGNRFNIRILGIPKEGTYTQTSETITLHPEKALGMTLEELKKVQAEIKSQVDIAKELKPFDIKIVDGGKTLEIKDPTGGSGKIVFHREMPRGKVESTVSAAEKKLVGLYRGVGDQAELKKMKGSDRVMSEAMAKAAKLELLANNKFEASLVLKMTGTWILKDQKVMLNQEGNAASQTEGIEMQVQNGRLYVSQNGARLPFYFEKQ